MLKFTFNNAVKIIMWAFFLLQGLFAFRIVGPNITIQRLFLVIVYLWIFFNLERQNDFWQSIKGKKYRAIISCYLFICTYTAVFRRDFNTIFGVFVDCFLMYLLFLYILSYVESPESVLNLICKIVSIACILGIIEYITGFNLFAQLTFTNDVIPESLRDGILRIRVAYGHPLAYGMFLVLFFPFCCYDLKKSRIYLFNRPMTLMLVIVNILLTGSRSSIGIFGVELFLIAIITAKELKGRLLLTLIMIGIVGGFLLVAFLDNPFIQIAMRQIFYMIDELFDTQFAVDFGGDVSISNSSIARERLWKIFDYPGMNPVLGSGVTEKKFFYIDNWRVTSVDNFYVNQYIKFAYPGLIATICMFATYLWNCVRGFWVYHSSVFLLCLISGAAYMGNLIVVDELATIKYFFFLLAFTKVLIQNKGSLV